MFGIHFFKAQPPDYIIKYSSGRVARSGAGIAFYYLGYNTQIVAVPPAVRMRTSSSTKSRATFRR